jgi:adenosylcobyric acid synthase
LIPLIRHHLPEEDTLQYRAHPGLHTINLALIVYPYASNLDEFDPLLHEPEVTVVPLREYARLDGYHAILLPESKNTGASIEHLRTTGLAAEISRAAQRGVIVHGVCGGLQLLGHAIHDPDALEHGDCVGLGLLDLVTTLGPHKVTRQREVQWHGVRVRGYEIHHGVTRAGSRVQWDFSEDLGWSSGNVSGVYLHGLFENAAYREWFLCRLGWSGQTDGEWSAVVDASIDEVAHLICSTGLVTVVDSSGVGR